MWGSLNISKPYGPPQLVTGIALPFFYCLPYFYISCWTVYNFIIQLLKWSYFRTIYIADLLQTIFLYVLSQNGKMLSLQTTAILGDTDGIFSTCEVCILNCTHHLIKNVKFKAQQRSSSSRNFIISWCIWVHTSVKHVNWYTALWKIR
jgi:hypothetical protein